MKIEVKVGEDSFDVEAEHADVFTFRMFYLWIRSLGKGDQEKLDSIAKDLENSSTGLENAVQSNQPVK